MRVAKNCSSAAKQGWDYKSVDKNQALCEQKILVDFHENLKRLKFDGSSWESTTASSSLRTGVSGQMRTAVWDLLATLIKCYIVT